MTDDLQTDSAKWAALRPRLARYLPINLFNGLHTFPDNLIELSTSNPKLSRKRLASNLNRAILALEPLHRVLIQYLPRYLIELDLTPGEPHGEILEGSFIHADLKGFTTLTELMARQGNEQGQEAMNQMLNGLFKSLLDPLIASGGDLLIFAGDAILAYFPKQKGANNNENEDVLQAIRAGLRMERAIEPFSIVKNEFGQCTLTMRIGIERGVAYAGTVGTAHRMELLVSGPGIDKAMQAEAQANSGQIRLGTQATKIASSHFRLQKKTVIDDFGEDLGDYEVQLPKRRRGRSVIIGSDISELLTTLDTLLKRVERLAPFLPEDFLANLINTDRRRKLNVEFRPVAVQFIHISGLEQLALSQGAEFATDVFQHYFIRAQEIIKYHEGIVSQIDAYNGGFFLLNTFGSPKVHEGTTRYAVSAALHLAQLLEQVNREFALEAPLQQRGGITYGRTFNGEIGANYRRESVIAGPSVNRASRLMSKAEVGQVILDAEIWMQTESAFEGEHLSAVNLKGIDRPVVIINVREIRQGTRLQPPERPILGRTPELNKLREALNALTQGQSSAWLISGETGLGKTSLISTIAPIAKKQGLTVLVGRCQPHGKTIPLFPWVDLLVGWLDANERDDQVAQYQQLRAWLQQLNIPAAEAALLRVLELPTSALPTLVPPVPANETAKDQILAETMMRQSQSWVISLLIKKLAKQAPLIILFEDLHWVDQESLSLLKDLLADLPSLNILFMLTSRESTLNVSVLNHLPLAPLSGEALVQVAERHLMANSLEAELADWISQQAGGNPLYGEALCRALQEADAIILDRRAGIARWTGLEPVVPLVLHELLLDRFDKLPPIQQEVLKRAAVIGPSFTSEAVIQLALGKIDALDVENALQTVTLSSFISNETNHHYTFTHALMQEAIYATLSFSQRQQWHAQMGFWLSNCLTKGDYSLDLIAYHYLRSNDSEKGAEFGLQAAERAQRLGAYASALAYYQQVMKLPNAPSLKKVTAAKGQATVLALQQKIKREH